MCRRFYWCILWFAVFLSTQAQAEEFKFDPSEVEKKPYHLGGYLELKPSVSHTDKEASLYKLRFYDRSDEETLKQISGTAQLEGSLEKGIARLFARANFELDHSYLGWSDQGKLYEGYMALKPSDLFNLALGKQTMKWGKGYAWNPVAFVDRPKNPDEPDLNLEGFYMASANLIKSFDGPLKTISFTPVVIPAYGDINDDFGEPDKLNFAAKLYLLYYDTDIDFMLLAKGSKSPRYGFDFSRNLFTNLEIHGEFAWLPDSKKTMLEPTGKTLQEESDEASYLLGLRYLSTLDTTYIFEYYHNGTGYSEAEGEEFFSFIGRGYEDYISGRGDAALKKAQSLSEGGYGRPNFMKDYLYLRVSQKEPFNILYFTPALTWILNLEDKSFTLSPEILYTGITNLELRAKGSVLVGDDFSEYGEKQNDYRLELRVRYYF
ncbi:MAG: hypothetical protein COX16_14425 [Deltaproteobacteria bacterium CG23_combo_of_CG06-09_8_20_14_all_51_20]|nr:hypothetical protein [bacterium]NCP09570.1 hypothetical protein [bacterium]PIP45217.1 MAG: hypothetical protein COX16_14425 [Deltaproteobacteria bacterium CG23_combo_of_CG06-09_8_20_14_all_51_20]PJB36368.1 MAG: hypothetical protein CO107_07860 [Deltaproteobacteria bacterium CG_4_9_14_3_um_filter_51_14]